jgi:LssY C-terminus
MRIPQRLGNLNSCAIFSWVAATLCLLCAQFGFACDQLPAGETFRARLLQPVSSYSSKPGDKVRAILIESPQCAGLPIFPEGTPVVGHIQLVHKVGIGLRHEVAALEIEFDRIQPDGGPSIEMRARVLQVDNARERVKNGVIHGIRSFNAPQDRLSSRVGYLATWHPDTMLILPAYHALFPVFPEPELYFPSGTDLLLELSSPLTATGLSTLASPDPEFAAGEWDDLENMALSFPERSTTPRGQHADVVNLALVGSATQLTQAFLAAGWNRSEAMSGRAALREIDAFLMLKNNAQGPMSRQLLQGEPSDSSWEKGLDSVSKRDHLRIWSTPETWKGQPIWLSSSTRDVGANLSLRKARFVHSVEPNIDKERKRIVRDLTLAGCVDTVDDVARPAMSRFVVNATGGQMSTDGAIAVVKLRDCNHPLFKNDPEARELAARPRSGFVRYIRTQVLSTRDLWRENLGYEAFVITRSSIAAIRRDRLNHRNRESAPGETSPALSAGEAGQTVQLPLGSLGPLGVPVHAPRVEIGSTLLPPLSPSLLR